MLESGLDGKHNQSSSLLSQKDEIIARQQSEMKLMKNSLVKARIQSPLARSIGQITAG